MRAIIVLLSVAVLSGAQQLPKDSKLPAAKDKVKKIEQQIEANKAKNRAILKAKCESNTLRSKMTQAEAEHEEIVRLQTCRDEAAAARDWYQKKLEALDARQDTWNPTTKSFTFDRLEFERPNY